MDATRFEGTITTWKDSEGYGFITPSKGGKQVFVHIKSFSTARRRPSVNDIVSYELGMDGQGRPQAQSVAYADERVDPRAWFAPDYSHLALVAAFFLFLTGAAFAGRLPKAVVGLYAIASAIAFAVYAFDKSAAKHGRWRTPEVTLHFWGLMCGWPGALIAQSLFRHKTKKLSFQIMFWLTVVLNCMALFAVLSPVGTPMMREVLDAVGFGF